MTKELKSKIIGGFIGLAFSIVLMGVTWYVTKEDRESYQLDEKLKDDIAKAIINEILPKIDEKLPKTEFQEYKTSHDFQYIEDKRRIEEKYDMKYNELLTRINELTIVVKQNNKKIDENFIKVIDGQNDLYKILIKK